MLAKIANLRGKNPAAKRVRSGRISSLRQKTAKMLAEWLGRVVLQQPGMPILRHFKGEMGHMPSKNLAERLVPLVLKAPNKRTKTSTKWSKPVTPNTNTFQTRQQMLQSVLQHSY